MGSAEAQSEQLGRNTPEFRSVERDSDWREQEVQGKGVQQPSETAPGDADDLIQSGRSRGKS